MLSPLFSHQELFDVLWVCVCVNVCVGLFLSLSLSLSLCASLGVCVSLCMSLCVLCVCVSVSNASHVWGLSRSVCLSVAI